MHSPDAIYPMVNRKTVRTSFDRLVLHNQSKDSMVTNSYRTKTPQLESLGSKNQINIFSQRNSMVMKSPSETRSITGL